MTTTDTSDTTAREERPVPEGTGRMPVRGRVVLVTGAGGGMGTVLVSRFLDNGDTVVATDVSEEALDRLRGTRDHPALRTVAADITDPGTVAAVADVARRLGGTDVLVNCAGWFPYDTFADTDLERWRAVIDLNVTGPYLVTHAVLDQLTSRGRGRVINIGSGAVLSGVAGQVHYATAKAGGFGFTRSLARELGPHGVTVNQVTPGLTLTGPVASSVSEDVLRGQREGRALGRDQVAADLVGPVFFLASPDAGFITGQTLNVDGGLTMY